MQQQQRQPQLQQQQRQQQTQRRRHTSSPREGCLAAAQGSLPAGDPLFLLSALRSMFC